MNEVVDLRILPYVIHATRVKSDATDHATVGDLLAYSSVVPEHLPIGP